MKITQITVTHRRLINHPTQRYENIAEEVSYTAELELGDNESSATQTLMAKAREAVDQMLIEQIRLIIEQERIERGETAKLYDGEKDDFPF